MTYVQATTGGGGWPMSVWLTPDLKPFYGGTYYPSERLLRLPRASSSPQPLLLHLPNSASAC